MGSTRELSVDVRVIAATNRDLQSQVTERGFRTDLYHRIAVLVLHLPPLREREGDLGLLIDHLLQEVNRELASQPGYVEKKLSPGARNRLLHESWPGNVVSWAT